jgi:hypothetical protein
VRDLGCIAGIARFNGIAREFGLIAGIARFNGMCLTLVASPASTGLR